MDMRVSGAGLGGGICAIPSKSYAIRILIASALADKQTLIHLNGFHIKDESGCTQAAAYGRPQIQPQYVSDDIIAAVKALAAFGADITQENGTITVRPGVSGVEEIPCGESGTLARMLLPVAASLRDNATITGEGSLVSRPFATLCNTMEQNGCRFESKSLPISFTSRLMPGRYSISGSESSQYISGLLFALPLLDGDSEIVLTSPLESSGYIDMTISVLRAFGVEAAQSTTNNHCPPDRYLVRGGQKYISPTEIAVEGDWSNAAFWLAAGVDVMGLNPDSLQKDRLFLKLKDELAVDASEVPDLVPILAVCAASRHGTTRIYNAGRLRLKESDRLDTVYRMLHALGGDVEPLDDGLVIHGKAGLKGGVTDSFGDHRIAMAAAIAARWCEDDVIITNAQAVEKSYPGFFEDYNALGGETHVVEFR